MNETLKLYSELANISIDIERLDNNIFESLEKIQKLKSDITTKF